MFCKLKMSITTNNYGTTNGFAYERIRSASHAGSWYSSDPKELDSQLTDWLLKAGPRFGNARAIISPYVL